MRRRTSLLLLAALMLVGSACGQKAGVADSSSVAAGGSGGGDLGQPSAGTSDATDAAGDTSGGTVAPGTGVATGGGPSTPGAATGGGPSAATAGPGDRTGITDSTITIGLHAPLTGAAPVPTEAFRRGLPVYWEFIQKSEGGVFGRHVKVVFEDDEFNASTATRVCRKMVEQDKVFLLIGIAGADQITACAKYANSKGVPYISAGANEEGLAGLRGYFAGSQTYLQQTPILASLAKRLSQAGKFAVVIENSPAFRETKASIETAAKQQGLNVVYSKFISKGASQAEILTTTNDLRTAGADVVYFLGPPTTYIALAQQGASQAYIPAYIGPGLTNGLNLVATAGCPGISKSKFLSPFPQVDVIDKLDPNFSREYRSQTGNAPDDLGVGLWGLNKTIHQLFKAAGKDMSRQSLVSVMESGRPFDTGLYPHLQYSPRNHFGADSSHLLAADCNSRTFKTEATFVKG